MPLSAVEISLSVACIRQLLTCQFIFHFRLEFGILYLILDSLDALYQIDTLRTSCREIRRECGNDLLNLLLYVIVAGQAV